jgi:uncharacterized SAM-binding protein YcdF (DUF218 family)
MRFFNYTIFIILFFLTIWFSGLIIFIQHTKDITLDQSTKTDAIIVFTGGYHRIDSGIELLEKGLAQKLLISGVKSGIKIDNIATNNNLKDKISLGYDAQNTIGNAIETKHWLQENNFHSIRLVTSNYHMIRSIRKLKYIMPEIIIIPHPIPSENVKLDQWWDFPGTIKLIISEYNKNLLLYFIELISKKL